MPNYCSGTLTITASKSLLTEILNTIRGTDDQEGNPFDFNKVIPMPESEKENWYDWSVENWGTKWNSCNTELQGNTLRFWTAWSPCLPVIEGLAIRFPDAAFDYQYNETGMLFCGEIIYEHGQLVYVMEGNILVNSLADHDDESIKEYEEREQELKSFLEDNPSCVFDDNNGIQQGRYIEDFGSDGEYHEIYYGVYIDRRKAVKTEGAA